MYWDRLGEELRRFLSSAEDHAYLFAPFIQADVLSRVLPGGLPTTIVTSWRVDHLKAGVSDLEAYVAARENGQTAFYILSDIHLKLYGRDVTRAHGSALIGSANVTGPALGFASQCNREVLCRVGTFDVADRVMMQRLVSEARLVDDKVHAHFVEWLASARESGATATNLGDPNDSDDAGTLHLVTHLPLTESPARLWELFRGMQGEWWEEDAMIHDLALFAPSTASEEQFQQDLRTGLFGQPFVAKFVDEVGPEGIYFGRIKEWIQRNCEDVPTPRRRDLTQTVRALIRWMVSLAPDQFEVVRPAYSECLRRRPK